MVLKQYHPQIQERGDTTTNPVFQRILVSQIAQIKSTEEYVDAFCHSDLGLTLTQCDPWPWTPTLTSNTLQAPRKCFSTSLALKIKGDYVRMLWRFMGYSATQDRDRYCSGALGRFKPWKHLGKRKDKLINLSNPSCQHEGNRLLSYEVLFPSSA